MFDHSDYDAIRPYRDDEVQKIFHELAGEPDFLRLIGFLYPELSVKGFLKLLFSLNSIADFQEQVIAPYVQNIARLTADSLTIDGLEKLNKSTPYFYISNHRDIILDPAFLNILLISNSFDTTEIAIGDNLLIYPWIRHLVRLNKSFIVNRNVPVRQMFEVSQRLSDYIKHTMNDNGHSIWMAQREGRSKDANDRTHLAVLKMLNMSGDSNFIDNMKELNFLPVSISYEYDPCDFLKAREFLMKRDNPEFKKTSEDDLESMYTGLKGYKGRVHFHICEPIAHELSDLRDVGDRNQQVAGLAQLIDKHIHLNYRFYPGNYIAYDLLTGSDKFKDMYSQADKNKFHSYVENQLNKVPEKEKEYDFLLNSLIEMYSNPLINHYEAKGTPIM
ncbi:1-acyl-sn-glycerol-3-phosphate acyltransferase [Saccharicrinis sp. FJH54]|uniref:1-acyl-sn-glycerol-3-phosphate acyltransferase n=1 Tax=Saccharicrinis sp. FJH54 TaxID=3344665 RepID=UPI0035D4343D